MASRCRLRGTDRRATHALDVGCGTGTVARLTVLQAGSRGDVVMKPFGLVRELFGSNGGERLLFFTAMALIV